MVTFSFLGSSIPGFFLSLLLIYLFTVKLGWLPSGGMITLGTDGGALDVARHMVMPVLVLAFSMAGSNIRYIRCGAGNSSAGLSAHGKGKGNRALQGDL